MARKELYAAVKDLRDNPVPVGFIYVQLPHQPEPSELWPTVKWTQVTSQYAGRFFRAEGGDSSSFGYSQDDALQGHSHQYAYYSCDSGKVYYDYGDHSGYAKYCSSSIYSTGDIASKSGYGSPRTASETRPVNYAVRIWKRVANQLH